MPNANVYLPPQIVLPKTQIITAITQTYPMIVSVQDAGTYVIGQQIKLTIPNSYGMTQANQLNGTITAINGLNFTIDQDSRAFSAFSLPYPGASNATLASAGSLNIYNTLDVPFHAQSNRGN